MPSHKRSQEVDGKPTIELENHDQNVGQRESSHAGGKGGKPTIGPETHDANYGQRDTIDEEEELGVDEELDIEESRTSRATGEDIEESRGARANTDVEGSRGGRNGDDVEPYLGETRVISDDSEVE
ncbi:MAG TPA: hypothetical protein VFV99_20645 [Kofleriaceae bacterium]|nr:hypothetical protein [Kofleriaceae bacterium]